MKLLSIKIQDYKSIKEITFILDHTLQEQTYSLIGVNEAGKSSFLEAVNLFDERDKVIDKKFFHKERVPSKNIEVTFLYEECNDATADVREKMEARGIDQEIIDRVDIKSIAIKRVFEINTAGVLKLESIEFADNLEDCQYDSGAQKIVLKNAEVTDAEFSLEQCLTDNFDLLNVCYGRTHKALFWKSSSKYLIDQSVDLTVFGLNPREISVPLANCFNLAGTADDDISSKVDEVISDSVERKNFIGQLEKDVTDHIKNVWKEHQVKVKFDISGNLITFLVEDEGVENDNKTTDQRSDGFRQFISFLLSVSAENKTGELQNQLLLIDEPEQHLHPKAAEFLRDELIKITSKTEDNNVVFYATHSLFMIDQSVLERNYAVTKRDNKQSVIEKIDGGINTYSSIVYNVFNVYTNDYHNELIGWIQDEKDVFESSKFNDYLKLNIREKKAVYIEELKDGTDRKYNDVALSLYIRHQIHHPENRKNDKFSREELIKSIDELVKLKDSIISKADKDLPATI